MSKLEPMDSSRQPHLRRSTLLAAGSVTASAVVTLGALAATALILRILPRAEAGRFALLVELLYALGILGALGQASLQARLYQQAPPAHYNWPRDLSSTIALTFPAIALAVALLVQPYRLTSFEYAFLAIGSELFVLISCLSAVLAQQQEYAWSSALLRLPNGLLIVPASLMLVRRSWLNLQFILGTFLFLLGLVLLLALALLNRRLQRGGARITFKQRLPGLTFLVAVVAIIVTQRGMIAVAGAILTPERVAALAALIVLLRVFDLVGEPTGRVFSTEMARNPREITFGMLALPWMIALALSALLLVGLPPLTRQFYAGRYDAALPLLPWLVVAGALRLVELVPRGFAFYLAPTRALHLFALAQSIVAIVGLALMVKWTQNFDLRGTVWAGAIIAAIRVTISYVFFAQVRRRLTSRDERAIESVEIAGEEPPV